MGAVQTFDTEEILALKQRWSPIPKRPGYALGMAALLATVIILPLLYFAAIGAIGWGVWWHLTENMPQASGSGSRHGRRMAWGPLLLWIGPALAGVVLILFLLKPLFAPRAKRSEPYVLTPGEEPRLFAFVHAVCEVIGAPPPREIAVDSDVNASAGFRGGWLSLLKRDDLVLTIGMPLVAGMSKREFAGILAHEFGHFAQQSGMRITYAGSSLINWFARAAFERDAWDEWLNGLASIHPAMFIVVLLAKLCIFIARLVLIVVVYVCVGLCAVVLRQMEFDADRHQAKLVGSGALRSAHRRMLDLQVGFGRAEDRAKEMYRKNSNVPDNFAALVADYASRVTPEARAELERRTEESGLAKLFSTHPSWDVRLAKADALAEAGLLTDERPARELFTDFHGACLKASFGHYKARLGRFMGSATFVPTPAGAGVNAGSAGVGADGGEAGGLIPRYIGFEPPTWRPFFPQLKALPHADEPRRAMERLKAARGALQKIARAAAQQSEAYRTATEEANRCESAKFLMESQLPVDFKKLGLPKVSRIGLSQRIDDLRGKAADAAMVVDEANEAARDRLRAGLALLNARGIERLIPGAEANRARAEEMIAMLGALEKALPIAREVREKLACIEGIGYSVSNKATYDKAKVALRPLSDVVRDRLADARMIGGEVRCRSDTGESQTLGERLVGASPGWREFDQIIEAAERLAQAWPDEYHRAMTELVGLARGVEKAIADSASAAKAARTAGVAADGAAPVG